MCQLCPAPVSSLVLKHKQSPRKTGPGLMSPGPPAPPCSWASGPLLSALDGDRGPPASGTADQPGCVADPPYIDDSGQPAELALTPGAPLELRCDAQGIPPPNITWHKDGQALSLPEDRDPAGQVLRVKAVQVLRMSAVA